MMMMTSANGSNGGGYGVHQTAAAVFFNLEQNLIVVEIESLYSEHRLSKVNIISI
jgi:hypothetical protein